MFALTIAVILTVFILDIALSVLNYSYRNRPVPENVKDVYDRQEYKKWLRYTMENYRISIIGKSFRTLVLILFLLLGFFPYLADITSAYTGHPILETLLFLGIFYLINYLLNIGFSIYGTFSIEERYGFNKTTAKTFTTDQLKSILLTAVLGGGLLYGLIFLYLRMENYFLLYAWIASVFLVLIINVLFSRVFIRIFNKLTPLEEGPLKEEIVSLVDKTRYEIKKISIMDASKRSTKLNAFFSGFGRFRHIVLFDTLVEKCPPDQVTSVLAHEIGHSENKDTLKNFVISMVQIAIYLAVLAYFLSSQSFAQAFGFETIHLGFAIILFGILIEPLDIVMNIFLSGFSRKAEYRADAFAAVVGYREAMIKALKTLARENYANLTPHPLVVKLTYSHPPISNRIHALENKPVTKDK